MLNKAKVFWESYHPLIAAIIVGVAGYAYGIDAVSYAAKNGWSNDAIFSSVFDLSSIIVAFVFGFFTFARTSETEFIHAMRKTETFKRFMNFVLSALYANAILVLITIPYMVVSPLPNSKTDASYFLIIGWAMVVVYAILATIRTMRQFIVFAMVEKRV